MREKSEILRAIYNPEKHRKKTCHYLYQIRDLKLKIMSAKGKINTNFEKYVAHRLDEVKKDARKEVKSIVDGYKNESEDHKEVRKSFLECINSQNARSANPALNQPPFVDEKGKPLNLVRYWNENFMIDHFRNDGWSPVGISGALGMLN